MVSSGTMKASPSEETFRLVSAQDSLGPVSEAWVLLAIGTYIPSLGGEPRAVTVGCMFWLSLGQP